MGVKRPALLVGGVILAAALGTAGAWLTWPRQASTPRTAGATRTTPAPALVAPAKPEAKSAAPIVVPEAAPPPEPTSAEFARAAAPGSETPAAGASEPPAATPPASIDWTALPIDELRTRASDDELPAMEEMARRLVQGVGVPKDQQAGAGWLLRAAQHGSAQSAFNVGVMYERGFVVERDSTRAVEWYRKAADANLPIAKQHLALMLREGKGVARNGQEAIDLLRAASRQGQAVSMFTLGDIYERGDLVPKDPALALAWYAITSEFDRQTNRGGGDNAIAKTAAQRAQALRSTLLPGDLERAQQAGQLEFKQIVEALQPPKPPPPLVPSDLPPVPLPAPALPPAAFPVPAPGKAADAEPDPPGWPKAANDQISAIQQALVDLKLLSDKPDGAIGPVTRTAIRAFQRSTGARETGEPTKDVFAALQGAVARRSAAASAPSTAPTIDLGASEPPPPPTSEDIARAAPLPQEKTELSESRTANRTGTNRAGTNPTGLDRTGPHRTGPNRIGHRSRCARAAAGAAHVGGHRARGVGARGEDRTPRRSNRQRQCRRRSIHPSRRCPGSRRRRLPRRRSRPRRMDPSRRRLKPRPRRPSISGSPSRRRRRRPRPTSPAPKRGRRRPPTR